MNDSSILMLILKYFMIKEYFRNSLKCIVETHVKNLEMVTYWFFKSHLSLLRNTKHEPQLSRHFGTVEMLEDISVHGFMLSFPLSIDYHSSYWCCRTCYRDVKVGFCICQQRHEGHKYFCEKGVFCSLNSIV